MLEQEKEIIERAKAGDVECFGRLYDHYVSKIYRFVYVKTSSKHETEDLTHEVFLSAWKNLNRYEHKGFPFSSWLYTLARNKVIDYYRLKKKHASLENIDPDSEWVKKDVTIDKDFDTELHIDKVRELLTLLTSDQQDVIIMRFMEELSYGEIAKALGKSEGAVRLIQHRAINELKKIFPKEI